MNTKWLLIVAVFSALSMSSLTAQESPTEPARVSTEPIDFTFDLQSLDGEVHALSQNDKQHSRVFVFLSPSCPISNAYTQELNRLHRQKVDSVDFFAVVSDRFETRQESLKHYEEYALGFPVLFDSSGLLASVLKPTHVPEVFVVDAERKLVYRGAIDNAFEAIGRRRPTVEHHYLSDAISSLSRNERPEVTYSKPVGCVWPEVSENDSVAAVTYNRDIAPLLQTRCQNCHREGQVAPFELTTYEDARAHADMLVQVTQDRIMPPWIPGPNSTRKFVGERWLTDLELELLKTWVEAGCPEGDSADLPPSPQFAEGWLLGEPDSIVKMTEPFSVPADGPDLLQNFVIPIEIPSDKLVAAIEFHPGNRRVVHHAVLFLDDKGEARKLDEATPEPGYSNFGGPGFVPSGALGGWSVGNTARRLPNDMGRYLKQGSDLVVQVHYHPTGKVEIDQSEIGLYFVQKPVAESIAEPAKLVGSIWMANYEMDIPAGESNYGRSTTYRLPKDVVMVGIVPHMHLLGKSMRVTATQPGQDPEVLIDIENWNYNWQDEYYYEEPFQLAAGTLLRVEAVFDNSENNPSNPSSPPQRVTWGEETDDEMLFCFFLLTAEKTEDLIHTIYDNLGHDLRQNRSDVGERNR